jgi:hypothetical protein
MRNFAVWAAMTCALLVPAYGAFAETAATPAPSGSTESTDQGLSQRLLTEKDVQNFIAAQKPIKAALDKIPEDKRDQPDAPMQAALDKLAAGFGFKDYGDFDEVGSNIQFILQGFDSEKKTFIGHEAVIKNEIANVTADKSMKPKDKAEELEQLKDALAHVDPVKYKESIPVVTKHYAELSAIFDN